jgi:hypothetical protein
LEEVQSWNPYTSRVYNKLENNGHLNNKRALYLNMKEYYEAQGLDVEDSLPLTFVILDSVTDPEFLKFKNYYYN